MAAQKNVERKPAYQQGRDLALDKVSFVDGQIVAGDLSLLGALHALAAFHYESLTGRCLAWEMPEFAAAYHQTLMDHETALKSLGVDAA